MAKKRILKVFCAGEARDNLVEKHGEIAEYDAFVLLELTPTSAKKVASLLPSEDITDLYQIQVGTETIDTSQPRLTSEGIFSKHPAYEGVKKLSKGPHHYLVQFIGPIKQKWLRQVKKLGGDPRRPYSDFTYIVRCDASTLAELAKLPFVRWVGHLSHRDRLFSRLDPEKESLPRTKYLPTAHKLEFFDADDMADALRDLQRLGVKVLSTSKRSATATIELTGSEAKQKKVLEELSAVHGVLAIRNFSLKRTSNDVSAGLMNADTTWLESLGLTGDGETIAICDTGLDTGDASTIHPDFDGRVAAMKSYPVGSVFDDFINNPGGDDGPADLDSGHGTHVAGSATGSGVASANLPNQPALIRGVAHEAKIVFQAVEQELDWKSFADELEYGRFLLAGIPDDLTMLFSYAYSKGARIHSNSWGGGDAGAYDSQCYDLDEFVWNKKDLCVLVAAGNDGTDDDGDGAINQTSVTSPATAKNCITVGASESRRPQFDAARYGDWWPNDYPAEPIKSDPIADDPQQVVAFSSRGPTLDGRVKPDLIAPGTFILSTRSVKIASNNMAWGAFPSSRMYFYMGGTSMATPLVAGAAAIMRQYLRSWVGYSSPSAALIKACLVLGSRKLPGVGTPGAAPDNDQGFGLINLRSIIDPPSPAEVLFVDQVSGLHTGEEEVIDINVQSSGTPLHVVLAYSDYPGAALVNNLNLFLEAPNGSIHVGNGSQGAMTPDTKNNLERIIVENPSVGEWKLRIVGSNVSHGPQDYAIVVRGDAS